MIFIMLTVNIGIHKVFEFDVHLEEFDIELIRSPKDGEAHGLFSIGYRQKTSADPG
jgi:hypothetical protein